MEEQFEHFADWRKCARCRHVAAIAVERSYSHYKCGCSGGANCGKWSQQLQSPTKIVGGKALQACPDFTADADLDEFGDSSAAVARAFARSGELLLKIFDDARHERPTRHYSEIVHTENGDELVYRTTVPVKH